MKRLLQVFVGAFLVGSLTVWAEPYRTWDWNEPKFYENNQPIPNTDLLVYTLRCSRFPLAPILTDQPITNPNGPPSTEDMEPTVQGVAGDYVCVMDARSTEKGTTSGYSNESPFTVTSGQLGFVPSPPTNLSNSQQ